MACYVPVPMSVAGMATATQGANRKPIYDNAVVLVQHVCRVCSVSATRRLRPGSYGLRRYSHHLGRDMLCPMIGADQSESKHHTATLGLRYLFLNKEKSAASRTDAEE